MVVEHDFTKYDFTDKDVEALRSLLYTLPEPNTEPPSAPPDRHVIIGDVFEGDEVVDPNKIKRENDEDKSDDNEPTKH